MGVVGGGGAVRGPGPEMGSAAPRNRGLGVGCLDRASPASPEPDAAAYGLPGHPPRL